MDIETLLSLLRSEKVELLSKSHEIKEKYFRNNVTFSRNLFVPVTHLCRNRCGYCSFVSDDVNSWINPDNYKELLTKAKVARCKEILLTLGEKPEEKYQNARDYLASFGFETTVDYVNSFCDIALEKHLLPHSNLGVLNYEELSDLKETNASMGLMLETVSSRLMEEGQPHYFSPGKRPSLRLDTISSAGKLKIPFTTGILIGIGETWEERIESLQAINDIHKKFNHIQEVIIQNFNPQPKTPMSDYPPPKDEEVLLTLSVARLLLHPSISIQIPPNLNRTRIIDALNSGANDLGGVSPISVDYINPDMGWHDEDNLKLLLEAERFKLRERLPVYPQYEKYLNSRIREIIEEYRANEETL
jgi:7,8-didemethyl-8-hydroxy-5-deazariboflavin synthase CofG subunit